MASKVPLRIAVLAALALVPGMAAAESLLELYDKAMTTNPALRGRALGVDEARAQKDVARSELLPHLSADGSYDWNEYDEEGFPPDRYEGVRGVLSARQALFDMSAYHRYRGAKVGVEQSEYERVAVEMAVAAEVIDRYLNVLQAEDEITFIASEKKAIQSQLERLRFMRERQMAKVTDLYEVEAYYQSLLTREIEAANARSVSLARLRETTSVPVARVPRLAREDFPAIPGNEEQWTRDAVATNPDVLALERATESARRLMESVRSQHLPRVSLTGASVYADQGYDNRAVPPYQVGSVGVEVTVPIYEGGRINASVREAQARHGVAAEQYEAARREVEANAREAYLNAIAAHARTKSTAEERKAMDKLVEAQDKSYERGVTTIQDVLIARRRLTKALSDESKAQYDYIRALSALHAQTGSLRRPQVENLDQWFVAAGP